MFDSMKRVQQLQKVAQDPTESELVQAAVHIIAGIEHRQLRAVEGLHDELGIDGIDVQAAQDEREEQLLAVVDAMANQRFQEWWFDEVVQDNIENADDAMAYAGLTDEEWQDQKGSWADTWREKVGHDFDAKTDEDLARIHVERKFGVSLREFEREIVQWSRREALRNVIAGNLEGVEQAIRAATASLQDEADDEGGEASE